MSELPNRKWKKDQLIAFARENKIDIDEGGNNFAILAVIQKTIKPVKEKKSTKTKDKPKYEISFFDLNASRLFLEFEIKGENKENLRKLADKKLNKIAKRFKCKIEDLWIQNVFASDQLMKVTVEMPIHFVMTQLRKVVESC